MKYPAFDEFFPRFLLLLPFASDSFYYDDPREWAISYPQCLGPRQSPIPLKIIKSLRVSMPPIHFGFYYVPFNEFAEIRNNGRTAEFEIPKTVHDERPFITGGPLEDDTYEAVGVHFHWGSRQAKGSEHEINGNKYDLEMHIVHKNFKYESLELAREFEDGLAVLSVLFKVVKSPNVYYPGLNAVYDTLEDIIEYNSTRTINNLITLGSLLADMNREQFYTYKGSLTTPPCSQAVTWIVFPDTLPIAHTVLRRFWRLLDDRDEKLINNFRPLQLRNFRDVYYVKTDTNFIF